MDQRRLRKRPEDGPDEQGSICRSGPSVCRITGEFYLVFPDEGWTQGEQDLQGHRLFHVIAEGDGALRRLITERSDGRSFLLERHFEGDRHDFLFILPAPLTMKLSPETSVRVMESHWVTEDVSEHVSRLMDQAFAYRATLCNVDEVLVQERDHPEWCRAWPECFQLELTKACNFRCMHCGTHGGQEIHREMNSSQALSESLLDKMAEEVFPLVRRVSLVGSGEPFLAPRSLLTRLIHHLDQTQTRMEASTNGSLLTEDLSHAIRPLLSHLCFSIDAATPETFKRVRRSDQFEKIMATIRRFQRFRDEGPISRWFDISMAFTLMRENVAELSDFIRLAKGLGVNAVYVRHLLVHSPEMKGQTLIDAPELANPAILEATSLANELGLAGFLPDLIVSPISPACGGSAQEGPPSETAAETKTPRIHCCFLWRTVSVFSNGDVYPCGGLKPPLLGNLDKDSFAQIWNGELIRDMRRRLETPDPHPMCAQCWYRELSYFDSSAVDEGFTQRRMRDPKEKRYDASAFTFRS